MVSGWDGYYRLRSAEDLAFEPDDNIRREILDGVMYVCPPTDDDHAWKVHVLDRAVGANAPDEVYLFQTIGVHTGFRRYQVPDLTAVWQGAAFHTFGYHAAGVLLAVEVVSAGSLTMDRVAKPAIYAQAGIPLFWRVDEGPVLQTYQLDPRTGQYVLDVELGPGEKGSPAAPWPVTVDTTDLVMPHKR
jgi:Uma2 family endonuclease